MKRKAALLLSGGLAIAAGAYPAFQRLVLLPVYLQQPGFEPWLAWANRLSAILITPGKFVMYRISPPRQHYFITPSFLWACLINAALIFLVVAISTGVFRKRRPKHSAIVQPATEPDLLPHDVPLSIPRRSFLLKSTASVAGFAAVGFGLNQVLLAPERLQIRRLTLPIKDLPPSLDGLTIAQLTDIHHDEWISLHDVRRAVEMTNAAKPDFVALTGDYVTANASLIAPAIQELKRLTPKIGMAACLGNHDWWADAKETQRQFAKANIPVIDNDRLFISPDRTLRTQSDDGLCIAAVGDLWEDTVDSEKAMHKVPTSMPRILMSHNPDVAEQGAVATGVSRIDLMLSGHTHGGQVRLPVLGTPLLPSAYGQKYAQGLVQGPSCKVQVSAGIGLAIMPVRFNVQPEIVIITLKSA